MIILINLHYISISSDVNSCAMAERNTACNNVHPGIAKHFK